MATHPCPRSFDPHLTPKPYGRPRLKSPENKGFRADASCPVNPDGGVVRIHAPGWTLAPCEAPWPGSDARRRARSTHRSTVTKIVLLLRRLPRKDAPIAEYERWGLGPPDVVLA